MKKILSLLVCLCMLIPRGVWAAPGEVTAVLNEDTMYNIYIEGTAADVNCVTIALKNNGVIGYVGEADIEKNGSYRMKFGFNKDIHDYKLYVNDRATGAPLTSTVTIAEARPGMISMDLKLSNSEPGKNYIDEKDIVKAAAKIRNKYFTSYNYSIILAAYDIEGRLLGAKTARQQAGYEIDQTADINLSDYNLPANTKKAKLFAWSGLEPAIPLARADALTEPVSVYMIGSSLCQGYDDAYYYPRKGCGQYIENYFTDALHFSNDSMAGWSIKGLYLSSGTGSIEKLMDPGNSKWKQLLDKVKPGDYVMILVSGINEIWQNGMDTYYPCEGGDYTYDGVNYTKVAEGTGNYKLFTFKCQAGDYDGAGNYVPAEYDSYLSAMVQETLDKHANPILFTATGTISSKINEKTGLLLKGDEKYDIAGSEIAKKYGVTFLDSGRRAYGHFTQMGYQPAVDKYFLTDTAIKYYETIGKIGEAFIKDAGGNYPVDTVHYNVAGANYIASMIIEELSESDSKLAFYLNR